MSPRPFFCSPYEASRCLRASFPSSVRVPCRETQLSKHLSQTIGRFKAVERCGSSD
jgi:hypothetical protein